MQQIQRIGNKASCGDKEALNRAMEKEAKSGRKLVFSTPAKKWCGKKSSHPAATIKTTHPHQTNAAHTPWRRKPQPDCHIKSTARCRIATFPLPPLGHPSHTDATKQQPASKHDTGTLQQQKNGHARITPPPQPCAPPFNIIAASPPPSPRPGPHHHRHHQRTKEEGSQ